MDCNNYYYKGNYEDCHKYNNKLNCCCGEDSNAIVKCKTGATGPQGIPGVQGETGSTGAIGPTGATGVCESCSGGVCPQYEIGYIEEISPGDEGGSFAFCPIGTIAVGGSISYTDGTVPLVSSPYGDGTLTGWVATARNTTSETVSIQAVAVCLPKSEDCPSPKIDNSKLLPLPIIGAPA